MDSVPRKCAGCDVDIVPGPRERNKRKWCSESCRVRAYEARTGRSSYAPRSAISFADCDECGETFVVRRPQKDQNRGLTCRSSECRRARKARLQREWYRKYKAEHGVAYTTAKQFPSRALAAQKRYAMTRGSAVVEEVDRDVVFERDGWVCQLCGDPVNSSIEYPHPMSKSLDHVKPIALGGEHTYENTQLAHLVCNARKGARGEVA